MRAPDAVGPSQHGLDARRTDVQHGFDATVPIHHRRTSMLCFRRSALLTVLAVFCLAGNWSVGDDANIVVASGLTEARDYRVTNNGPDDMIIVVARKADGSIHASVLVPANESRDIGVPEGGSLTIDDQIDANSTAASGTYETLP